VPLRCGRQRTSRSFPCPYTKGALYQLYVAPAQVTDIALEPGEELVSVSAGDTVRRVVGDTTSGEGKDAIVHILVKPIGADLETNLVITTDRRTYHLEMRSSAATYMASVSWTYPASELLALKKQRAEADVTAGVIADAGINIERLKFRYRIEGDAPWRPLRVFDDGAKVYIQFPSGLAQSEAPPLFVIGPDAKPALVNYRVRGATCEGDVHLGSACTDQQTQLPLRHAELQGHTLRRRTRRL
jgi:type IV secretion system protein VirB9